MDNISLKEHIEKILDEKEKSYTQRFSSQEKAIETAEHSRDVAIKKAEDSIEKRSDAVYVKVTDLEKSLAAVMLRPEIEARFTSFTEKIDELKTSKDEIKGKGVGLNAALGYILAAIAIAGFLLK